MRTITRNYINIRIASNLPYTNLGADPSFHLSWLLAVLHKVAWIFLLPRFWGFSLCMSNLELSTISNFGLSVIKMFYVHNMLSHIFLMYCGEN